MLLGDWLCSQSLGGEKNCAVYHLFCKFFITIIPSFVVLLNCCYLNPQVLLFVHSPPHHIGGGKEQVSACMILVAGERLCGA